jgi:hypothetical protein
LKTSPFHLFGFSSVDIIENYPIPIKNDLIIDGDECWAWIEVVKDTDRNHDIECEVRIRFSNDKVHAIGIWSKKYNFIPNIADTGPYFTGQLKEKGDSDESMKWVKKLGDDFYLLQ